MIKEKNGVSLGTAALITGLTLFVPTAPYAEFSVFEKLVVYDDAAKTVQNIREHPGKFLSGIYAMLFTFIVDVVLSWTMFIFLKPVNASLALLGAWLRVLYAAIAIAALFNFLHAYHLVNMPGIDDAFRNQQVLQHVNARKSAMNLAYLVFGLYLVFGGILMYRASYIPKVMGVLIALAGVAYSLVSMRPYFFADYDFTWLMIFYAGEVVFAIWLLVRGRKIKDADFGYKPATNDKS